MTHERTWSEWIEDIDVALDGVSCEVDLCNQFGCDRPGFCPESEEAVAHFVDLAAAFVAWYATRVAAPLN